MKFLLTRQPFLCYKSPRSQGRINKALCGNNSVVECNLAKVEVAGSNPVSRSK